MKGNVMPEPKKRTKSNQDKFDDPIIARKKKPGEDFEVPVFKDKPEIKPPVIDPKPELPDTKKP